MNEATDTQLRWLLIFAQRNGYKKIEEIVTKIISQKMTMQEDRYKLIRNAILFNKPQTALKLLAQYDKVDYEKIDINTAAVMGGE